MRKRWHCFQKINNRQSGHTVMLFLTVEQMLRSSFTNWGKVDEKPMVVLFYSLIENKLIFRKQKSNKEQTKAWYPCHIK